MLTSRHVRYGLRSRIEQANVRATTLPAKSMTHTHFYLCNGSIEECAFVGSFLVAPPFARLYYPWCCRPQTDSKRTALLKHHRVHGCVVARQQTATACVPWSVYRLAGAYFIFALSVTSDFGQAPSMPHAHLFAGHGTLTSHRPTLVLCSLF
mmetsp:Transcript_13681/g.42320  ORF Transcript_13681/g.42320 Transcript_13681/m.42320 type:complete len:152 (-) Transcript_13681:128-583(-)